MTARKPTRAEELVAELADLRHKQSQYEEWRWQASVTFYVSGVRTRTTTETSVLGFKSRSNGERWDEMPAAVADEFHSFFAKKRDEAYRRIGEIEQELERLS